MTSICIRELRKIGVHLHLAQAHDVSLDHERVFTAEQKAEAKFVGVGYILNAASNMAKFWLKCG